MNKTTTGWIVIGLVGLLGVNQANGQEAEMPQENVPAQINAASQQLLDGNIDQALAAYEVVAQSVADNHELNYNRAIAYYQNGNIEKARSLFARSLNTTRRELAAKSSFNLGNCDYSDAIKQAAQEPEGAIQSLDKAIGHYRSSLRIDSEDADARANIELALLMRQLLQEKQEEQEQEEQEQEEQKQEEQQNDEENGEENDEKKGEEKGEENEEEKGEDQQNEDQQSEDQEGENQEEDSESQDSGEKDADSKDSESTDSEGESQDRQGDEEGKQQPGQPEDDQPSKEQEEASDQESTGEVSEEPLATDSDVLSGVPTGKLDPQEAMKMLQAIRDRDLMRRMQQLRRVQRRHIPVERDW